MKEINKIIQAYDAIDWAHEQVALATVVRVEESAYRRIGARLLVSTSGFWTGGISGGCLEGDALKRAQMAIARDESSLVIYDTLQDDAHQIGIGLGCNGRIDVLFTPIDPQNSSNPVELLKKIRNQRTPSVLYQIIGVNPENKRQLGQLAMENQAEEFAASIGVDSETLLGWTKTCKASRKSDVRSILTNRQIMYDILIEFVRPRVKLVCIGDNYDVNAFVSIGHELNWEVHVAGKSRKLSRYAFEFADKIHDYESVRQLPLDDYSAVILMSHDYKIDLALLRHFINYPVPYLGLLGPKKRMIKMRDELLASSPPIDLEKNTNLRAPVGLDIGAESPEEIALSIAAEIIAVMRGREGTFLKDRMGPIHDR
ncbi:MAG TPA: XdhC family protein [Saprospiraceae bacterium]|nr:XdhC family protein [Saprospiraceae bacterium]